MDDGSWCSSWSHEEVEELPSNEESWWSRYRSRCRSRWSYGEVESPFSLLKPEVEEAAPAVEEAGHHESDFLFANSSECTHYGYRSPDYFGSFKRRKAPLYKLAEGIYEDDVRPAAYQTLKNWLYCPENLIYPYVTNAQRKQLSQDTGVPEKQIQYFYRNNRSVIKDKLSRWVLRWDDDADEDYDFETFRSKKKRTDQQNFRKLKINLQHYRELKHVLEDMRQNVLDGFENLGLLDDQQSHFVPFFDRTILRRAKERKLSVELTIPINVKDDDQIQAMILMHEIVKLVSADAAVHFFSDPNFFCTLGTKLPSHNIIEDSAICVGNDSDLEIFVGGGSFQFCSMHTGYRGIYLLRFQNLSPQLFFAQSKAGSSNIPNPSQKRAMKNMKRSKTGSRLFGNFFKNTILLNQSFKYSDGISCCLNTLVFYKLNQAVIALCSKVMRPLDYIVEIIIDLKVLKSYEDCIGKMLDCVIIEEDSFYVKSEITIA